MIDMGYGTYSVYRTATQHKCKYCYTRINLGDTHCSHCGAPIEGEQPYMFGASTMVMDLW